MYKGAARRAGTRNLSIPIVGVTPPVTIRASFERQTPWQSVPSRPRLPDFTRAPSTVGPYARERAYARGEWLQHEKFGLGLVTDVEEQKVEVCFADGASRKLVAGRRA
jgi:hypothetical protein